MEKGCREKRKMWSARCGKCMKGGGEFIGREDTKTWHKTNTLS